MSRRSNLSSDPSAPQSVRAEAKPWYAAGDIRGFALPTLALAWFDPWLSAIDLDVRRQVRAIIGAATAAVSLTVESWAFLVACAAAIIAAPLRRPAQPTSRSGPG